MSIPAQAQEPSSGAIDAGFYGGVALRARGAESVGLNMANATSSWSRFGTLPVDDATPRALAFGGYRWRNEVAVEALFSSRDKYALRPADATPAGSGVGLGVAPGPLSYADLQSRNWNLDVYTSWAFYKSFALYGRLGYGIAEAASTFAGTSLTNGIDPRRFRDGVNYGVGLRYDMRSDLGLRLEYGRFARFGTDAGTILPDTDQLTFGVQFRF